VSLRPRQIHHKQYVQCIWPPTVLVRGLIKTDLGVELALCATQIHVHTNVSTTCTCTDELLDGDDRTKHVNWSLNLPFSGVVHADRSEKVLVKKHFTCGRICTPPSTNIDWSAGSRGRLRWEATPPPDTRTNIPCGRACTHRLEGRVGEIGVAAEGNLRVRGHSLVEVLYDQKFVRGQNDLPNVLRLIQKNKKNMSIAKKWKWAWRHVTGYGGSRWYASTFDIETLETSPSKRTSRPAGISSPRGSSHGPFSKPDDQWAPPVKRGRHWERC